MAKAFHYQHARRTLRLESLESRRLMAADTAMAFPAPAIPSAVPAFTLGPPGLGNLNFPPFNFFELQGFL